MRTNLSNRAHPHIFVTGLLIANDRINYYQALKTRDYKVNLYIDVMYSQDYTWWTCHPDGY